MTIRNLPTAVNPTDYPPNQPIVHIGIQLLQLIRLFWITTLINRFANRLRFHFFLLSVLNAKGDEELALIEEVVTIPLSRVISMPIKLLPIDWNMLYNQQSEMNRSLRITLNSKPINISLISQKQRIMQFLIPALVFRLFLLKSSTIFTLQSLILILQFEFVWPMGQLNTSIKSWIWVPSLDMLLSYLLPLKLLSALDLSWNWATKFIFPCQVSDYSLTANSSTKECMIETDAYFKLIYRILSYHLCPPINLHYQMNLVSTPTFLLMFRTQKLNRKNCLNLKSDSSELQIDRQIQLIHLWLRKHFGFINAWVILHVKS